MILPCLHVVHCINRKCKVHTEWKVKKKKKKGTQVFCFSLSEQYCVDCVMFEVVTSHWQVVTYSMLSKPSAGQIVLFDTLLSSVHQTSVICHLSCKFWSFETKSITNRVWLMIIHHQWAYSENIFFWTYFLYDCQIFFQLLYDTVLDRTSLKCCRW